MNAEETDRYFKKCNDELIISLKNSILLKEKIIGESSGYNHDPSITDEVKRHLSRVYDYMRETIIEDLKSIEVFKEINDRINDKYSILY